MCFSSWLLRKQQVDREHICKEKTYSKWNHVELATTCIHWPFNGA